MSLLLRKLRRDILVSRILVSRILKISYLASRIFKFSYLAFSNSRTSHQGGRCMPSDGWTQNQPLRHLNLDFPRVQVKRIILFLKVAVLLWSWPKCVQMWRIMWRTKWKWWSSKVSKRLTVILHNRGRYYKKYEVGRSFDSWFVLAIS